MIFFPSSNYHFLRQTQSYYAYKHIQMQNLKSVNIWEEAVKDKAKDQIVNSSERALIVVGGLSVGKSTFLKVLKNEGQTQVKPTHLFQYSYIRKGHAKKELINCYEIGNKNQMDIVPSLFNKDNFQQVTVAICVDLSRPATIIDDVTQWISALKKETGNALHEKIGMQEKYSQWQQKRKTENSSHEDSKSIQIAPLNLVIVGCKYDLFEKYETENRKWLSKAIRYLSHINNASLTYCSSSKNLNLGSLIRSFFNEAMFEERPKIISQKDHLKPIYIYRNQDSLNQISIPTSGSLSGVQVLKRQLSGLFTGEEQKKRQGIDISKYCEGKIESLLQERKKQMAKIAKSLGKRSFQ